MRRLVYGSVPGVGRFAYKRYSKRRTAYGITTRRALIADRRPVSDLPLHNQMVTVKRTRDGRHASVLFGVTADLGRGIAFRNSANTGMDLLARGASLSFAFYDVADPDAMLAALERARTQPAV